MPYILIMKGYVEMIKYKLKIKEPCELEIISIYTLFSHNKYKEKINGRYSKKIEAYKHSIPKEIINGVYILYNKGEIIKVGQSKNIFTRFTSYISNKKHRIDFDSFSIIECKNDIDKFLTEGVYVYLYKPKFNKCMNSKI